jgi:hypothetical protein
MKESTTYQAILEEGVAIGIANAMAMKPTRYCFCKAASCLASLRLKSKLF